MELPLIVVAGSRPSLLSQDWLSKIRLDWQSMFATCVEETLADLIRWHEEIFQDDQGTLKGGRSNLAHHP